MPESDIQPHARDVAALLHERALRLVTAESCTGGLIVASLTEIPGSSDWIECGFVTYSVDAKQRMLGVRAETIAHHGAVSEPTAREMALGALERSQADVAVSVTGIAGPSGGDVLQPVGTVWFGWALRTPGEIVFESAVHVFEGSRTEVRHAATKAALSGLRSLLDKDQ
jgi:nicotinamide-nucleotide amidase